MKLAAVLSIGVAFASVGSVALGQTKSELRFDRIKYPPGDCLQITVDDDDEDRSASVPDSVTVRLVSAYPAASSGDRETLTLHETGPSTGRFVLPTCLPLVVGAGIPDDGMFHVHAGDLIAAVYSDPDNPSGEPLPTDAAADTALVSGGMPTGAFQYSVDPTILPPDMTSTPGVAPGEPPRPLAMVVTAGNVPQFFGEDQLILRSARTTEPADFLAERNGTLVEQVTIDPGPSPGAGRPYYLVRVDPAQQDLADFAYVMELFGASGNYVFSSDAAVRLMAMLFEEQLGGRFVMHNRLLLPEAPPVTSDGDCDGNGLPGDDGFTCGAWMTNATIGLDRAILYMDMIDANVAASVRVAIVDGGFAGPDDYRVGDVPDDDNNPDFGAPFESISQGNCDEDCDGSAAGPNMTRCAGGTGGNCDWHGTLTFSVAGAVADNGWGSFGVAGHARDATGMDGASGILDPILLEVGYPYTTAVARAVEEATARNAAIINISSGAPCEPLGINICDGGTRVGVSVACFLILAALDPGGVCVQLVSTLIDAGFTDVDVLEGAIADAHDAGVVVVAAGPEDVDLGPLGDMGEFDAVDDNWIPCNIPDVLCVGSLGTDLNPSPFNPIGSGIDIWAPGRNLVTTTVPGGRGANTTFTGTSAAAPFITGVVAMLKAIAPGLTPDGVRDTLMVTSQGLPGGSPAGDCIPHPDGMTPCVGSVDAAAAVSLVGTVSLTCSGVEADADDTRETATPVELPGAGLFAAGPSAGVHALPADEDWYSFEVPDLGAPSTEVEIRLDVPHPDYGTLVMELWRDADVVETIEAFHGVARFHAYFIVGAHYSLRIRAQDPATTNDNCYGGGLTFLVVGPGPAPDALEPNNTSGTAADLTDPAWVHEHFDPAIVGDAFTLVTESEDSWTVTIPNLSLHDVNDFDFFRLTLPDPGDGVTWPGHGDIDPDPLSVEPLPECGVVSRNGFLGDPDTVIFNGFLTIKILPVLDPGDDEVRFVDPILAQAAFGSALSRTIACPRRTMADTGLTEVLFSFGDRIGLGVRNVMVAYDLVIEYKIDIQRVPGGGGGGGGGSDPGNLPAPLPCLGDFFPNCVGGGEGWDLEHPFAFDLPCLMDGCEDRFLFNWAHESPLELLFSSSADLTFELLDLRGDRIATALPIPVQALTVEPLLPVATVTKRLFVPALPRGQYLLVIRGPSASYRIVFPAGDGDADGWTDPQDNCSTLWNPSQSDGDMDQIGDACDCSPSDPTIWGTPAEVRGVRMRRSPLGTDHVDLSWIPLTYQAGPTTVYDVIRGSLATLQTGAGFPASVGCLAEDVATSGIVQPEDLPPADDGYWYLVRAENPCGTGTWGDGTPAPDPRDALDTVECAPALPVLSISKAASPDPVAAGADLTYTIRFENTGDGDATDVIVTDQIPQNTTFVSASGGGVLVSPTVRWDLGTVPAGSSGVLQLVVHVASPLANGTVITNGQYSIDSAETATPVGGAAVTTTVVSSPVLSISKTDSPDPVPAGGTIVYTIGYQNMGNANATGVVVVDTVPANTAFVSASGGATPNSAGVLQWSLGTLPAGSGGSVQLTVRVTSSTVSTITNGTYSIDSAETSPVTGTAVSTTVLPPPTVAIDLDPSTPTTIDSTRTISVSTSTLDIGVIVNASGTAGIGDIARIAFGVINAFNTGGATVTGVTPLSIVDLMPPQTSPNDATFGALAGEFQLGGALIERGVPGSPYLGPAVQFARFRLTFGSRATGATVRVFLGDAGPGSFAVRAASGADISGDVTSDGTPVGGVAGSDQGAGAGLNYRDAVITFQ